jgi:hypothetical protein
MATASQKITEIKFFVLILHVHRLYNDHNTAILLNVLKQCFGSVVTFWYGYESVKPYLSITDPDPDPALFVSDLQDAKKNCLAF